MGAGAGRGGGERDCMLAIRSHLSVVDRGSSH